MFNAANVTEQYGDDIAAQGQPYNGSGIPANGSHNSVNIISRLDALHLTGGGFAVIMREVLKMYDGEVRVWNGNDL